MTQLLQYAMMEKRLKDCWLHKSCFIEMHAPCETQKQLRMSSALTDLWPRGPLGYDENVYELIFKGIKTKNVGVEIVTSAFVKELKKLLHKRKQLHATCKWVWSYFMLILCEVKFFAVARTVMPHSWLSRLSAGNQSLLYGQPPSEILKKGASNNCLCSEMAPRVTYHSFREWKAYPPAWWA